METVSEGEVGDIVNLKIGGGGIASDTKYRVMTCLESPYALSGDQPLAIRTKVCKILVRFDNF